jgi:chloramphenicol 3-O-phosphotransferase
LHACETPRSFRWRAIELSWVTSPVGPTPFRHTNDARRCAKRIGKKLTFQRLISVTIIHSMKLVFVHGPIASGKLTIAKELGRITGYAVFHNHLVVDAVAAVFPFGTEQFVRLREKMWLDMMREAAMAERSLIFTFAPEPTVVEGFDRRVVESVRGAGGSTHFVRLTVPVAVQEERLTAPSRAAYGKLQSVELLRELRAQFEAAERAMPRGEVVVDTSAVAPAEAARAIAETLGLALLPPPH